MKNKKIFMLFFFIGIFLITTNLVSALNWDIDRFFDVVKEDFTSILSVLFSSSEYLLEKLLFLLILLAVIYTILKNITIFQDKPGVCWIITICVSLIISRFMTEFQWFLAILLPYNVLGAAMLSILPFLMYFYFVEKSLQEPFMRRIAWIVYIMIFVGIWYNRYNEIGNVAWVFMGSAILALLSMLFDRTIQGAYVRRALMEGFSNDKMREILRLQKKIKEDMELLETSSGDTRRKLLKAIAENERTVKKLSKRPYN